MTATSSTSGSRCSTSSARRPASTPTTAATPAPWPAASSAPATRWWCCPAARPAASPRSTDPNGAVAEAFPPMAVSISLADDIDISRGDMLARPQNQPVATTEFDATVCWMADDAALRTRPRLHHQADHPHHPGARHRSGLPPRRQHPAPRQERHRAEAQRTRPGEPAHPGPTAARRVHPQRRHRFVHPDRPRHQRHRRGRHGARHRPGGHPHRDTEHRAARLAGHRLRPADQGPHAVVHRAVRIGQILDGGPRRTDCCSNTARPPTSSTATTCATD